MKVIVTIHIVLLALTVLCSARPEGEAVAESEGEGAECPVVEENLISDKQAIFKLFLNMNIECIAPRAERPLTAQLAEVNTTDEYREIVKGYCNKLLIISECLVRARDLGQRCIPDQTERGVHSWQSRLIQLLAEVFCSQDGARLVPILFAENSRSDSRVSVLDKCFHRSIFIIEEHPHSPSQFSLQQYQILTMFKECIGELRNGNEIVVNGFVELLNEVIERVTCEEAVSGAEVLCKTVIERECRPPEDDDTNDEIKSIRFIEQDLECYLNNSENTNFKRNIQTARTVEELRSFFKVVCEKTATIKQCKSGTKLYAGFCLHGRERDVFRVVTSLMDFVHEMTCADEGDRLSTIIADMRATLNASDNIVGRCSVGVLEGMNEDEAENTNFRLIQYLVMKGFKNCLAAYGREHNQAVVDLANFLGEGVERMTCPDEKTGDDVDCSTIPHNLK